MKLDMWIRALESSKKFAGLVLPAILDQIASEYGDRLALIGETEQVTYHDLARRVNAFAVSAIQQDVAGKTVALLMHNCPDYVAIWLGLTRVGCKVALLNTNLNRDALMHWLKASNAQYLIGQYDLTAPLADAMPILQLRSDCGVPDWPLPRPQDVALFIYTSGTTGFPKAVNITHRRIMDWCSWFAGMTSSTPDDRLYDCLPMYHSVGGIVAIGSMLVAGASVVVRRRFSCSRFWDDVCETGCTIFQYIGELCRYLTLAPHSPNERKHALRLALGNGLQADVWQKFQDRFGIPQILEYFAATEGVLSLYNFDGKPGAIGQIPKFFEPYFAVKLIRVDEETGEPIRNGDGFCVESRIGEPGEAITSLRNRVFDGYHDTEVSSRKILSGAFANDDRWYRSGDLMRRCDEGFFFFVDRMGDSFRWKGENVSTTEVANVVRQCPGVLDAIVYGVQVAGTEGRAGMAAVTTTEHFSLTTLADHLKRLPTYARPMFVRLCETLDTTGTFKLAKRRFVAENYNHSIDPVWRYDFLQGKFEPMATVGGAAGCWDTSSAD
jgi:fatty-acyl-CoA synthase